MPQEEPSHRTATREARRTSLRDAHMKADLTGFEPATSGLTGRRALQAAPQVPVTDKQLPVGMSCHCCRVDGDDPQTRFRDPRR